MKKAPRINSALPSVPCGVVFPTNPSTARFAALSWLTVPITVRIYGATTFAEQLETFVHDPSFLSRKEVSARIEFHRTSSSDLY